jgi:uncharacterized protein
MQDSGMKNISLVIIGWLVFGMHLQAASFDCGKVSLKIEKLICGDDELSKLDETLSKTYRQALARSGDDKPQVIAEQRQWLKITHMSCKDAVCLKELYVKRIHELTEYSYIPAHFGVCETDPNHTMQQIVDGARTKQINIGIVGGGVKSILRKDITGPLTDGSLVDFYRIPKGISFRAITGTYVNIRRSEAFLLPEISEEFHSIGLAYGMGRSFEVKAICEVSTRQGEVMLAFRQDGGIERGTLYYVPKKDFELIQTPAE